jgi:tetratricopeptide (TPR) repeat protein
MARTENLLRRAAECRERGDLAGAVKRYREYLRMTPEDAEHWHTLGGLEYQRGHIPDAIKALQKAVALQPAGNDYLNDLAGLYLAGGHSAEAEEICRRLLREYPDYLPAAYNLALACSRQGRLYDCIQILHELVQRKPDWAEAHYNLGVTLAELGHYEAALPAFQMAVRLQPYLSAGHIGLAQTLRQLAYTRTAIEHFRRGLEIHPDNIEPAFELADALTDDGQTGEAIRLLETLWPRHQDNADIPATLGVLWHTLGDARQAERWFDTALKTDPNNGIAIYGKAHVRRYTGTDKETIRSLEYYLRHGSLTEQQGAACHFALGKMHDDLKNYDVAFAHFQAANAIRKRKNRYNHQEMTEWFEQTIKFFTREFIDSLLPLGSPSDLPVFVVGMPRSGTTLVEQIIASHPQAYGAGELMFFQRIIANLPWLLRFDQPFPACVTRLTAEIAAQITDNYLALLKRHSASARRIVNKRPANYMVLGFLTGLFPNARIIHCVRDPLDVCLSIYFQSFQEGHEYSWDLMDIGRYYCLYTRLMRHWRTVMADRFLDVNYEELVAAPEGSSRRLIEYCGLPWDDQCLRFYETRREVKTASLWQVRQPIYKTSARRWQNYARYLEPLRELLASECA